MTGTNGSENEVGSGHEAASVASPLSDVEIAVLAFEKQWWKYAGAKETAIREQFGVSMTRYYQVLNALIDSPAAVAADPLTVGRLRRLRAARQHQRSSRRWTGGTA